MCHIFTSGKGIGWNMIQIQGSDTITVKAGNSRTEGGSEETFTVHKGLLCSNSQFFLAALRHEWKETVDRVIKLPAIEPEDFRVYFQWLYTNQLLPTEPTVNKGQNEIPGNANARALYGTEKWPEWFAIEHFLQDDAFKDAVVDAIVTMAINMSKVPVDVIQYHLVQPIYMFTEKGSPMRSLPADIIVSKFAPKDYIELTHWNADYSPPDIFWPRVVAAQVKFLDAGGDYDNLPELDPARTYKYHEHTLRDDPCYKIGRP